MNDQSNPRFNNYLVGNKGEFRKGHVRKANPINNGMYNEPKYFNNIENRKNDIKIHKFNYGKINVNNMNMNNDDIKYQNQNQIIQKNNVNENDNKFI